nr:hypothetical protein GCM10010200_013950 [Actinomadura rugatobispora]
MATRICGERSPTTAPDTTEALARTGEGSGAMLPPPWRDPRACRSRKDRGRRAFGAKGGAR